MVQAPLSAVMKIRNTCKFFLCKISGRYSLPHLPSPEFSHSIKEPFSWWNYALFPKPFLAFHNRENLNEILEILPPPITNNRAFSDFRIKVLRGTLIILVIQKLTPIRNSWIFRSSYSFFVDNINERHEHVTQYSRHPTGPSSASAMSKIGNNSKVFNFMVLSLVSRVSWLWFFIQIPCIGGDIDK